MQPLVVATRIAQAVTLVLLVAAGSAAAAYAFTDPGWEIDLHHAGNPEPDASYREIMGSGACVFDYDGDGWEDLFVVNARYDDPILQGFYDPRSALYRNAEGTGFTKVPDTLDESAWGMGCAVGDFDGDGDGDVALSTWGAGNLLFRNDGAGVFTNVTASAGVRDSACGVEACFGASLAWLDYDRDGDLDLYVLNYVEWDGVGEAAPNRQPGQCNSLFRNDGDGTFTDVTDAADAADCDRNHLGLAIADYDNDGWQDIYIASDESPNALLRNNGDGTFTDQALVAGVADTRGGMGVAAGDFTNDGRMDVFMTHFEGEGFGLYKQIEGFLFEDVAEDVGLEWTWDFVGWGTNFVDVNMDGWLDLVMVNGHVNVSYTGNRERSGGFAYAQRDLVYLNDGTGSFINATASMWDSPRDGVSRGLAFGDFDRDGYLDPVVVNNANESVFVWRSTRGPNNWLRLMLTGDAANPDALGAVVRVEAGDLSYVREVVAAASYESQSTRALHLGLGAHTTIDALTVTWADGTVDAFEDVRVNAEAVLARTGALDVTRVYPVAAAPEALTGTMLDTFTLTGSVVEAGAGIVARSWTVNGETFTTDEVTWDAPDRGTYEAVYRIEDALGRIDEAVTTIEVTTIAPIAVIEAPASADRLTAVVFNGSQSSDADGTVVSWDWDIDGVARMGREVEHTFTALGTHTVTLTVTDTHGTTGSTTHAIDVLNLMPVARAGDDRAGNQQSRFVFLRGASHDADGDIVTWEWRFVDGAVGTCDAAACSVIGPGLDVFGAGVRKTFTAQGEQTVTLTVTDNDGGTATDTLVVTITGHHPTARLTVPPTVPRTVAAVLDASASSDEAGALVAFEWDFGDGTTATCDAVGCTHYEGATVIGTSPDPARVTHAFTTLGVHAVSVTVTDDDGFTDETTEHVDVVNHAPSVTLPASASRRDPGVVTLTAAATDPDGAPARYAWDFGDGSSWACDASACNDDAETSAARADGAAVRHTFSGLGTFTVSVTVTDDNGATDVATMLVWVYAHPVAEPGPARRADRTTVIAFDGTASSDADGAVVAYVWDFGDGAGAAGAAPVHTYAALGVFTVTLTVTDDDGYRDTATTTVSVDNLPPVAVATGDRLLNLHQDGAWSGAASTDADGDVVAFAWHVAGDAVGNGATLQHAFSSTGLLPLRLTVTDDDGATATAEVLVRVVDWLGVEVVMDRDAFAPTETVRGEVRVVFANGAPAPGVDVAAVITYEVHRGSGPPLPLRELEHARVAGVTDATGVYRFAVPPSATQSTDAGTFIVHAPTTAGLPHAPYGRERVDATVAWRGNGGVATTHYDVSVAPEPVAIAR